MDDDTHKHKMKERGREIERERKRGHCAAAHIMKSLILSAQYFISLCTLQWFCGIIYTPIKTLITYTLVQCSLSLAQLNCFFSLL